MVDMKYKLGGASVALLAAYLYGGILAVVVAAGTLAFLKAATIPATTKAPAAKTPDRRPNPYERGSGGIGATPFDERDRPMAIRLYVFDGRKWGIDTKGSTLAEMDIEWVDRGSNCGTKKAWALTRGGSQFKNVGSSWHASGFQQEEDADGNERIILFATESAEMVRLKFISELRCEAFVADVKDKCFENKFGIEATFENKVEIYGSDGVDYMRGDGGDVGADAWDYDDDEEAADLGSRVQGGAAGAQLLSMGAGSKSFAIHGSVIKPYDNGPGALTDPGVTTTVRRSGGGCGLGFSQALLHQGEAQMLMRPEESNGVVQYDLGSGSVIKEWSTESGGAAVDSGVLANRSKGAQLGSDSSFFSMGPKSLWRWDTRTESGVVEAGSSLSQHGANVMSSGAKLWMGLHSKPLGGGFTSMATSGDDGCIAVGSMDGSVRLYDTRSLKTAKTCFPGLGFPITSLDVTYNGSFILATTDHEILLLSTRFRGSRGPTTAFSTKMPAANRPAPRYLTISPRDAKKAGANPKFKGAAFSFVTDSGTPESRIVASYGGLACVWNFRAVKAQAKKGRAAQCEVFDEQRSGIGGIVSRFMHSNFGSQSRSAPLVVANDSELVYY